DLDAGGEAAVLVGGRVGQRQRGAAGDVDVAAAAQAGAVLVEHDALLDVDVAAVEPVALDVEQAGAMLDEAVAGGARRHDRRGVAPHRAAVAAALVHDDLDNGRVETADGSVIDRDGAGARDRATRAADQLS